MSDSFPRIKKVPRFTCAWKTVLQLIHLVLTRVLQSGKRSIFTENMSKRKELGDKVVDKDTVMDDESGDDEVGRN